MTSKIDSIATDRFVLTHRNHINRWEHDDNDHWNAQFYIRSFSQSSAVLGTIASGRKRGESEVSVQHARFFSELRGSDGLVVLSARIADGAYGGCVAHLMQNSRNRRVCAASIEALRFDVSALPSVHEAQIRPILPRGLEFGVEEPFDTAVVLKDNRGVVSYLGVIQKSDLDHTQSLHPAGVHARLSSGAANLWSHTGASLDTLHSKRLGPVVAETKGNFYASAAEGDAVRLVSWFDRIEEKSLRMRHQLERLEDGRPLATVSSIILLIDREARRSISLPDFVRTAVAAKGAPKP
jgi:acyl-CoA thioesterase FadM